MTGCVISHVTVMNCIHAEGALIEAAPGASALKISQEEIFLEVDGLWVHLQEHTHRKKALARFLYEQARSTKSFELKIAAAYVGKRRVAPGRFARDGLALACSAGDVDAFWERAYRLVDDNYAVEDLERVWLGADGGRLVRAGKARRGAPGRRRGSLLARPVPHHAKGVQGLPRGAALGLGGEFGYAPQSRRARAHVRAHSAQGGNKQG